MQIIANGSKWYGQEPDNIDRLINLLSSRPLDPAFEEFGNLYFADDSPANAGKGLFCIWGNFYDYSHVFDIIGTEQELKIVKAAVQINQSSTEYQKAKREHLAHKSAAFQREEQGLKAEALKHQGR